jgi:hypothetical protein
MIPRIERVTNLQIDNPQNSEKVPALKPLDILKNRFKFLKDNPDSGYQSIYSSALNKTDLVRQKEESFARFRNLPVGHEKKEAINNYYKALHLELACSPFDEDYQEKQKATALSYDYLAREARNLMQAQDLQEGLPEKQEKEKLADLERYMADALKSTINQVQNLEQAERLTVGSPKRQEKEKRAREQEALAKEALYRVRKDYYVKFEKELADECAQKESEKRRVADENEVEIEFPEWLNKEIEDLKSDKLQPEKSDEEKLRWTAFKQLKRFLPDGTLTQEGKSIRLTPDQEESIISDWMINRRDELIKAEKDWNEEVEYWTEHSKWKDASLSETPEEQEQEEAVLKDAYKMWTDPYGLTRELTYWGWGEAIVKIRMP